MKKGGGFTLIELMVVMSIVAILATAGISAYTNYLKGARDSVRATVAREVATKVEAYSGISGPPNPAQVAAFLTAESTTVKDPLGGKPVCIDDTGQARIVCKISYHLFTDGTYAISYGVEKVKDLINPHYSNMVDGEEVDDAYEIYGSFIGNNRTLSVTPTTPTVHLENKPDLTANGIDVNASCLSSSGSYVNGAVSGGDEGGVLPGSLDLLEGPCTADIDCMSGLVCSSAFGDKCMIEGTVPATPGSLGMGQLFCTSDIDCISGLVCTTGHYCACPGGRCL